ncbi:MAG: hypothetical protein ABEJ87_04995 [Candidatus Nanohalobium sp.]
MGEKVVELFDEVREQKGEIGVRKLVNNTALDEEKAEEVADEEYYENVKEAVDEILEEDFKQGETQ